MEKLGHEPALAVLPAPPREAPTPQPADGPDPCEEPRPRRDTVLWAFVSIGMLLWGFAAYEVLRHLV